MYKTVIALDLETTGADPYSDEIIEIGAAVYEDGCVIDTFDELVATGRTLRPGIISLTGITPAMLADARPRETVLDDFLAWLPAGTLCLAHNASFDRTFLRNATKDRFSATVLDTVGLSRICFPELPSHSLSFLCEALHLPQDGAHRALSDCTTLLGLWEAILQRARALPLPVVAEINYLLATHRTHPFRDFFQRLEAELHTSRFGKTDGRLDAVLGASVPRVVPPLPLEDKEDWQTLDPGEVADAFSETGTLSRSLERFESRPGQMDMARNVTLAFNTRTHLMVEAGTGTGKSMAYLIPAVLWSLRNRVPVVVSTNTKNLQTQLFEKDIPLIRRALGVEFKSALIKGRGNYICLRKLHYLIRQCDQELEPDERLQMATVLSWVSQTTTGDISECIITGRPGFGALWMKMGTSSEECLGKACPQQGRCFLAAARAQALAADVIVANHSLVFSELNMKSPTLPPYRQIVFDEAHNLEDAATRHLSVELSQTRFTFALGRIYRAGRRKSSSGLVRSLQAQLTSDACTADPELVTMAQDRAHAIPEMVLAVGAQAQNFFLELEGVLDAADEGGSVRFCPERKRESVWVPITEAKTLLGESVALLMRELERLLQDLREMEPGSVPYLRDLQRDTEASVGRLREMMEDLEFVLAADHEKYVYWVERIGGNKTGARAWAAPTSVGDLLYDQVYARRDSVIFCSATLSVRGSFQFLGHRLGTDRIGEDALTTLDVGTPFDYARQCQVMAPIFLPEPGERGRDYAAELTQLLEEVFRRTRGRGMVLFTSYDMLRRVSTVLNDTLLPDGISVLSQGTSGSRENITALFKKDIHSVLLGTHSFWEGVDVVGETLSCLAIARLPFAVFTDPIHQARCEQVEAEGRNAFMHYSLPSAVIRFRQGFGRLIRHKSDRGIVIVADRRIVSKRYGNWFRDSIPAPMGTFPDRAAFLDAVSSFLGDAEADRADATS